MRTFLARNGNRKNGRKNMPTVFPPATVGFSKIFFRFLFFLLIWYPIGLHDIRRQSERNFSVPAFIPNIVATYVHGHRQAPPQNPYMALTLSPAALHSLWTSTSRPILYLQSGLDLTQTHSYGSHFFCGNLCGNLLSFSSNLYVSTSLW